MNSSGWLWDRQYTSSWTGWSNVGTNLASNPEAVGVGSSVYAFAVDVYGGVQYKVWNSSWGSWIDLDGTLAID